MTKIIEFGFHYDKGLDIVLTVPLVSKIKYHRMTVIPFPDDKTKTIVNFNQTDVVVNTVDAKYIDLNEMTALAINDSLSIVTSSIIRRITAETSCAVRMVSISNQECPLRSLSKDYDEWFTTPLHNVVQFMSNKEKALVCPTERKRIVMNSGVIKIPFQCFIQTNKLNIRASMEFTKTVKKMVKVAFDDNEFLYNKTKMLTMHFTDILPENPELFNFHNDELVEALLEDVANEGRWPIWMIIVVAVNGIIGIAFVVWIILRLLKLTNRVTELNAKKSNERDIEF